MSMEHSSNPGPPQAGDDPLDGGLPPPPPPPSFSFSGFPPAVPEAWGVPALPASPPSKVVPAVVTSVVALLVASLLVGLVVVPALARHGHRQGGREAAHRATGPARVVADPSDPGVAVEPSEAGSVAMRLWRALILGMHEHNAQMIASVTSGPTRAVDLGLCGCQAFPLVKATSESLLVPYQTRWPARFVATVSYTEDCDTGYHPCDNTFVAVQPHRGAPWTISLFVGYSGSPVAGWQGYDPSVSGAGSVSTLTAAYARYLTAIKHTGRPPSSTPFVAGPFTTQLIAKNYWPKWKFTAAGYRDSMTYWPLRGPRYEVETTAGVLSCGTVEGRDVMTSLGHEVFVQPLDRRNWWATVPPGYYTHIVTYFVHMDCFIPSSTDPSKIFVLGDWSGPVRSVVTPSR